MLRGYEETKALVVPHIQSTSFYPTYVWRRGGIQKNTQMPTDIRPNDDTKDPLHSRKNTGAAQNIHYGSVMGYKDKNWLVKTYIRQVSCIVFWRKSTLTCRRGTG